MANNYSNKALLFQGKKSNNYSNFLIIKLKRIKKIQLLQRSGLIVLMN